MDTGQSPSPKTFKSVSDDIEHEAASWEGTPFVWRSCVKHQGVDCATYLHAVFNRFYTMPPLPQKYGQGWLLYGDDPLWLTYLEGIANWHPAPSPGMCVLVKFGENYSHGGFIERRGHVWHCSGRGGKAGVVLSPMSLFARHDKMYFTIRDELLRDG